jgi:uncharacterized protein YjdB
MKKNLFKSILSAAMMLLISSLSAQTVKLVMWDFPTASGLPDSGILANMNQTIVREGTYAGTYTYSAGAPAGGANCMSSTGWDAGVGTKYWVTDFTTTGYDSIKFSSILRGNGNGPKHLKLQYKTSAAGAWTDLPGGNIVDSTDWTHGATSNLLLPKACWNTSQVFIRWLLVSDTAVHNTVNTIILAAGASRIDDILVIGVTITTSVPVTGIILNPATLSIYAGNKNQLTAMIKPVNATNQNITWYTSNAAVATVSNAGLVTAVAAGTANIIVTTLDGNYKDTCKVTVPSTLPIGILLAKWTFPHSNRLSNGGIAINLNKPINRENGFAGNYYYTIGAKGAGDTCLSSDFWDAGAGVKYWVTDINTLGYDSIRLSSVQRANAAGPKDFIIQYSIDSALTWSNVPLVTIIDSTDWTHGVINNILLPKSCSNKKNLFIRWMLTSDNGVAAPAVLSASMGRIDSIFITGVNYIPVTGVMLTAHNITIAMLSSKKGKLYAKVYPANASDTSLIWTSTDTTVLQVSSNGLVTGIQCSGQAKVIVKSNDGSFSDTCSVVLWCEDLKNNLISNLSIFPNPSNGEIKLALNIPDAELVTVSIVDETGNVVYTEKNIPAQGVKTMALTQLPSGLYFININTRESSATQKLMIVK